ncbi:MAG: hypothetical protein JWO62_2284 [Acidimicrobiaceae bacterium]|nr:hypothetical protein [Acidimicrobiaceae bacterium]
MAGYGTSLFVAPTFDPLVRALLHAAQRRAKALGLRLHYSRRDAGSTSEWEISVDGPGGRIASWAYQIERDLPVVAEGYTGSGSGKQAQAVAHSLVARWVGWCVGGEEDTTIKVTGSDRSNWFWPIIDIPTPPCPLAARMALSDSIVARWITGDLPEEIAIEELHTVVEALLRSLKPNGKGDWPALLAHAKKERLPLQPEIDTLKDVQRQASNPS